MVLDFPSNPVNGQTYSDYYYDASISAWRNNGSKNALSGRLTSLEATPSGLVPVIPTSVSVGSGSATASSTGAVTFTAASSVTLNGVFNSTFTRYKFVLTSDSTVASEYQFARLTLAGAANAGTYRIRGTAQTSNGAPAQWGIDGSAIYINKTAGDSFASFDVSYPATTRRTIFIGGAFGYSGNETYFSIGAQHDSLAAYDGLQIYMNSGTMSGTIQVYGYRN